MISCIDLDIIFLIETHLRLKEDIDVENYTWIGHNRLKLSPRARRGSGGVGILIRNNVLREFDYSLLDCAHEDILWVELKHHNCKETTIKLCSCYLPPENSSRGNSAQLFYEILTEQLYSYMDGSLILIGGDFNARIGAKQDFNPQLDELPSRKAIDFSTNKFGDYLLDFLIDCRLCVLNGRGHSVKDNFTSVSTKGLAVVDYLCVPYDQLQYWEEFTVTPVTDILGDTKCNIISSALPDHSIVSATWVMSEFYVTQNGKNQISPMSKEKVAVVAASDKKYNVRDIPENIFVSYSFNSAIDNIIERLDHVKDLPDLDNIYSDFVKVVHKDMDSVLEYKHLSSARKSNHARRKPWWNKELQILWKEARLAEKLYRKAQSTVKQHLHDVFCKKRKLFDQTFRNSERDYFEKAIF